MIYSLEEFFANKQKRRTKISIRIKGYKVRTFIELCSLEDVSNCVLDFWKTVRLWVIIQHVVLVYIWFRNVILPYFFMCKCIKLLFGTHNLIAACKW